MTKLNESDWLKLRDFNKQIARRIQMKLPSDWCLTIDEIEGAVYDTFIKLLNNYKEGAMSPTSYCWQFGEMYTYRDLMREYGRLKNQIELLDDSDDEDSQPRQYGKGDIKALTVDERDERDLTIDANEILAKMPKLDRMIAQMVMEGHSYDDIAENLGIDRKTAMRRMKKYGKLKR